MVLLPLKKEKHFRLSEWSKHYAVAVAWHCSPFHTLETFPEKYKMSPLSCNLNSPSTVTGFLFGQQQVVVKKIRTSYTDKSGFTLHNSMFRCAFRQGQLDFFICNVMEIVDYFVMCTQELRYVPHVQTGSI